MMKRPGKKIEAVDKKTNNVIKTPSLLQQTSKIEQKLSLLKQQIVQKKKFSLQEKKPQIDQSLTTFMSKLNLSDYINILIENAIDSLDILKEIKQAELEQIGILKGHALKIIIHLRKDEERMKKQQIKRKDESENNKIHKNMTQTKQIIEQKHQIGVIDQIQTESFPINLTKKSFCLYCFNRCDSNFCSPNCIQLYNGMFSKYESNLHRAEQNFQKIQVKQEQQLSDHQEFLQNFDFLFDPQQNDFNSKEYEDIKSLVKK